MNCYIVEQVETTPYNTARLNLPETFTGGRTYAIQYGRRLVFSGAGELTTTLRIPAGIVNSATLDALLSNITNGVVDIKVDIGSDGTWDWTAAPNISGAATLNSPELATAFNAYWSAHGAPTAGTLDVPVTVYLGRAGQMLLTNLQLTPSGSSLRWVRLPAQTYSSVTLDLSLGDSGSGAYTVAADVGDDGSIDWSAAGNDAFPLALTTGNLAGAFNGYLSGRSGEVDVPVRLYVMPALSLKLTGFAATPVGQPDVSLTAGDITFGAASPTEGETVPIHLTIHNGGSLDSGPFTAAFFATLPGWGNWYLGSAFVPGVPAGGSAQTSLDWRTLGYTGTVPVRVEIDPYDRITETVETNNVATQTLTILTRPDLQVTDIALSDDEPVVGQTVVVTLTLRNRGQTDAGNQTVALYNGNPTSGGVALQSAQTSLVGGQTTPLTFTWVATAPGPYRLFALADRDDAVDEFDEGNNQQWRDVYVGLAGPILLDSGTPAEPVYTTTLGYGYVDAGQPDVTASCGGGTLPEETFRRDPGGAVVYRFDHLQPGHAYHLDLLLYECDGAGRQESVAVDGFPVAGPEDLGDGQVHRLSIRLDPALYADRVISVTVTAPGIDGAVVNQVNLHDIDYRYADAGGANDPAYPSGKRPRLYGWLNGVASDGWGTLPYQTVRVDQTDNELRYRFDGLERDKQYNLRFTFWQSSGSSRVLQVRVDGQDTGLMVDTGDYALHEETVQVPWGAYADDGSIIVSILRSNAASGAMVNEIALEELTQIIPPTCQVQGTPDWSQVYGNVTLFGQPAPPGTVIEAINPRGDTVGCFTVVNQGQYGVMKVYGEDNAANPPLPGLRAGECVTFRVNGVSAIPTPALNWQNDHALHPVNLEVGNTRFQNVSLQPNTWDLFSVNINPLGCSTPQTLANIEGRYDRVLGENGVYAPSLPDYAITLNNLQAGAGYYIHITHTTYLNALIEGIAIPVTTPISLHRGWNWVGYLPEGTWPITLALQSIDGQYQRVVGDVDSYDPSLPPGFNFLLTMEPGEGYWLYASNDTTLVYPAGPPPSPRMWKRDTARQCPPFARTPYFNLVYGQITVNGLPARPGSRVEVVTLRGEVAGCFTVQHEGLFGLMPVYGEDTTLNPPLPGFRPGEPLTFRVNGLPAETPNTLFWQDDKEPHAAEVQATRRVYLPLILREW